MGERLIVSRVRCCKVLGLTKQAKHSLILPAVLAAFLLAQNSLGQTPTIEGKVELPGGKPVSAAKVSISSPADPDRPLAEAATDETGKFRFRLEPRPDLEERQFLIVHAAHGKYGSAAGFIRSAGPHPSNNLTLILGVSPLQVNAPGSEAIGDWLLRRLTGSGGCSGAKTAACQEVAHLAAQYRHGENDHLLLERSLQLARRTGDEGSRLLAAWVMIRMGDLQGAEGLLGKYTGEGHDSVERSFLQGVLYNLLNRPEESTAPLQRILRFFKKDALVQLELARAAALDEDWLTAQIMLEQAEKNGAQLADVVQMKSRSDVGKSVRNDTWDTFSHGEETGESETPDTQVKSELLQQPGRAVRSDVDWDSAVILGRPQSQATSPPRRDIPMAAGASTVDARPEIDWNAAVVLRGYGAYVMRAAPPVASMRRLRESKSPAPKGLDVMVQQPAELTQEFPRLQGMVFSSEPPPEEIRSILQRVGKNVSAFFAGFARTGATEVLRQLKLGKQNKILDSRSSKYFYVIAPEPRGWQWVIQEYRTEGSGLVNIVGGEGLSRGYMATTGFVSSLEAFHPDRQPGMSYRFLGTQQVGGRPVYVVAFAQRPAESQAMTGLCGVAGRCWSAHVQGVAWITATENQVLRMHTDLLHPLPEAKLKRICAEIDYRPRRVAGTDEMFWLPVGATVHMELSGRRLLNQHILSDFALFGVDTKGRSTRLRDEVDPHSSVIP